MTENTPENTPATTPANAGASTPAVRAEAITGTGTGEQWLARYSDSLMGVFGNPQRVLVRGAGALVWDADGKEYLDLLGGIAVNALGHAHPFVSSVIASQLSTLGHVSNFFTSPTQIALAEKLLDLAGAPAGSKVFFANSGTEANEAAFKLARAHGKANSPADGPARGTIVALEGGFHGRTMGALAMTAKQAYREPFEPMPAGVIHVPFNDVEALRAAVDSSVAAVILEPIQGEAGVRPLSAEYLKAAREITREAGALLILDEVQTGVGRTGEWFAGLGEDGVVPDAMTLAKGLGGGFPIGALVTFGQESSSLLTAGQHGTTFGGNPVATAAALATLHVIESQDVLGNVRRVSDRLAKGLAATPGVVEVRAHGLLIGFDLAQPVATQLVTAALDAGFIVNAPKPNTVRLAPPLILTAEQADTFLAALPALITSAVAAAEGAAS
ncbi:acetylornithine transaminase [Arthrobacter sp. 35W]|uniref:acetylornithine transaminase n=1 Tax=Arthrobacter sp. 35W TaxID=1132441 RepID=UPI00040E81C1|nr:acetylornithine transaminase [Arthrobacter sp. 35W]